MKALQCPQTTTVAVLAAIAPAFAGPIAPAQDAAATEPLHVDPRAERLLFDMGQYLGGAEAFEVHAETTKDEPHPSGQWVQVSRSSDIALHRARGLRASVVGDIVEREFWSDLEVAAMLDPSSSLYALVEVPGDLDGMIDHLLQEYGVSWPMADLAYSDPYVGLIEGVEIGSYIGKHRVEGIECHHLAFQQPGIDWQIWIDAGMHPVPRKMVITYKRIEGAPRIVSRFSNWNFAPHLPESFFEFEAPEAGQQVELESLEGN